MEAPPLETRTTFASQPKMFAKWRDVQHEPIAMPEREHQPDYARHPVPKEMYVPAVY